MARHELDHLADQLSGLLKDIDAAVRARFTDGTRSETRRRRSGTRSRQSLRGAAAATLRWLVGPARHR
jgi:hypothetical protein